MLHEKGYSFATQTQQEEVAYGIKEKLCFVALNYEQELQSFVSGSSMEQSYKLPDGCDITVGGECIKCPEALFKPSIAGLDPKALGIHEACNLSISKCDVDISTKLYGDIILSGGSTLFPNIATRLQKEVAAIAPPAARVKVIDLPERKFCPWIGGSIFSSLSDFEQMWITKQEYEESGPAIVHHKCF